MHVSLTSIIEVIKFKLLNQSIESKRTTFLSIFNTFESVVTILILGLLGILTELLGIYSSWFIFFCKQFNYLIDPLQTKQI